MAAYSTSTLVITTLIVVCTALSIALTYLPCYSSACSEEFFPLETRIHIGVYYALLLSLVIIFYLHAHWQSLEQLSNKSITSRRLPYLGASISYGGLFISFWILSIILVTTALWLQVKPFWNERLSVLSDWKSAAISTTVTTIIGHHVDLILGLVIIPVPRHSILCEAFGFPPGTLLWAHKALAYLLLIGTIAHGSAYMSYIAAVLQNPISQQATVSLLYPYATGNDQARSGAYSSLNFPSGLVLLVLLLVTTISALAWVRRHYYECFYYLHVTLAILFIIFSCLHANTNFYCLLPGLALWLYDWSWRLWGGAGGLLKTRLATIDDAKSGGWTRITLLPSVQDSREVAQHSKSSARQPLQTYYINVPSVSKVQCHAFTAISSQTNSEAQFLFQACPIRNDIPGWTARVANISAQEENQAVVRVEGPYTPNIPAMDKASNIVCFVGGTGITGALSIADWWMHRPPSVTTSTLSIYWSIRVAEMAQLPEWVSLCEAAKQHSSLHLMSHITSKLGRLNLEDTLREQTKQHAGHQSTWVYISGPQGLLNDGEDVCLAYKRAMSRDPSINHEFDWYAARWEV